MISVFGHAITVTAASLGITARTVLAVGFGYSWLFVHKERKAPKAVMFPRVATQVFIIATILSVRADVGLGLGPERASAAFLVPLGGALAFAILRGGIRLVRLAAVEPARLCTVPE